MFVAVSAGRFEVKNGIQVLFRCKKFLDFNTVAFSFLFDKHCLIME